jgi:hypothetical protein
MRQLDRPLGGFLTEIKDSGTRLRSYEAKSAFLDGASGIVLALLAGVSSIEPRWDCRLLLSGPSLQESKLC